MVLPEEGKREMRFDQLEIGMDRWVAKSALNPTYSFLFAMGGTYRNR